MSTSAIKELGVTLLSQPPLTLAIGATVAVGVCVAFVNCTKNPSTQKTGGKKKDANIQQQATEKTQKSESPRSRSPPAASTTVAATVAAASKPSSSNITSSSSATTATTARVQTTVAPAPTASKKQETDVKTPATSASGNKVVAVNSSARASASTSSPSNSGANSVKKSSIAVKSTLQAKVANSVSDSDSSDSDNSVHETITVPKSKSAYEGPKLHSTVITTHQDHINEHDADSFQPAKSRANKGKQAKEVAKAVPTPVKPTASSKQSKKAETVAASTPEIVEEKEEVVIPVAPTIERIIVVVRIENGGPDDLKEKTGRIIGKKGETIRQIEERTGTKIDVPGSKSSKETNTNPEPNVIIIGTDKQSCESARQIILELCKQGHSKALETSNPDNRETDVSFFAGYLGLLRKYRREIKSKCSVEMDIQVPENLIPKDLFKQEEELFQMEQKLVNTEFAKKVGDPTFQARLKWLSGMMRSNPQFFKQDHKDARDIEMINVWKIVTTKPQGVRPYVEKYSLKLNSPFFDLFVVPADTKVQKPIKVVVSGIAANVQKAVHTLKSLKKCAHSSLTHPNQVFEQLSLEYCERSGEIIGNKGENINFIKSKYNVECYIPQKGEKVYEFDAITLVGTEENIALAKVKIDDVIKRANERREKYLEMRAAKAAEDDDFARAGSNSGAPESPVSDPLYFAPPSDFQGTVEVADESKSLLYNLDDNDFPKFTKEVKEPKERLKQNSVVFQGHSDESSSPSTSPSTSPTADADADADAGFFPIIKKSTSGQKEQKEQKKRLAKEKTKN